MSDMESEYRHVWCPNCKAIRPAMFDELSGADVTGKYHGIDVVCGNRECCFVIATLYAPVEAPQMQQGRA